MSGFSMWLIILDTWQGFEYASDIEYTRVLNMLRYSYNYVIIIIINVNNIFLICLICTFRHSATNNLSFYNRVLNMLRYSYNNVIIIIITNVNNTLLVCLICTSRHSATNHLSFSNTSYNLRITNANLLLNQRFWNENLLFIYFF